MLFNYEDFDSLPSNYYFCLIVFTNRGEVSIWILENQTAISQFLERSSPLQLIQ